MPTIAVTTWSLEQTAPTDLLPAVAPDGDVRVVRSEVPSPEFSRFLYASVGGDIRWTDRLGWPYARWVEHLERPGVETWVAYDRGTPAGFVELEAQDDAVVEIVYFGLLPAFRGRRIGGHLLSYGAARAWDAGGDGRMVVDRICREAPGLLRPGGVLLLVQSALSGPDLTVVQLRAAGLKAAVTRRRRIALGPVLRGREHWLRERGLLPAADDKEELVVVRAELPV